MNDEQEAILEEALKYLKQGTMLCVCIRVLKSELPVAMNLCEIDKLYPIALTCNEEGKSNLFVSRRKEVIDILANLPEKPNSIESYAIGKLLGYGDDVLCDMMAK